MNTHQKYRTVDHTHFTFLYRNGDSSDYPASELMLVECEDGRWFIEQESGDEYSHFPGVVKSSTDLDTEPFFYSNIDTAATAAFVLIKQVYPTTDDKHLTNFLGGDE